MAKQVDDRERSSRVVAAAIEQHASTIASKVRDLLAPIAAEDGGAVPDIERFLKLSGKLLTSRSLTLVRASNAHDREMADDAEPRDRRDSRESSVRARLGGLRLNVQGAFGDAGLRALALWEPIPPGPGPLKNYAQSVLNALVQPGVTLVPLHADDAFEFKPAKAVDSLRALLAELTTALDDVARESVEFDTTLLAKSAAMAAHDRDFVSFAGVIERLALIAGLPELAERIRPSGREPGVLANPVEPGAAGDPVAPSAGTPARAPATPPVAPGMPGSNPFRD